MMIAHNLCLPRSYGKSFYCYTWIVLKLSRIWLENKQLLLPLWLKENFTLGRGFVYVTWERYDWKLITVCSPWAQQLECKILPRIWS